MLLVLDGLEGWSYKPVHKVQFLKAVLWTRSSAGGSE